MATLIRTILTSRFRLPSPDPSGITFLTHTGTLLVGDGEVDELDHLFTGSNLFETSLTGNFQRGYTALAFSEEVTGVSYNPNNRFLYFSDDDKARITQLNPGADGLYNTSDDTLTSFSTKRLGSTSDAEDVAYSTRTGHLYVMDGLGAEVYVYTTGGTLLRQFDTLSHGLKDPEGIVEDPTTGNLFLVGFPTNRVFEFTAGGDLVRTIDISAANALKPAGITIAPRSNGNGRSLYIVDRGVDNDDDPNENDGKIYEFALDSTVEPPPDDGAKQFMSFADSSGQVGGVAFSDEDILSYNQTTQRWSMYFDGSDVGIGSFDLRDFYINQDGSILFTLNNAATLAGVGVVTAFDIIRFTPTSTGSNTSGTFSLYFDGSDVGLDSSGERIDALTIAPDNRLIISVTSSISAPGISGADEDLIAFNATSLGDNTAGTWSMYFDGSDVGLTNSVEDVDSVWIDQTGKIYLSTEGAFGVTGLTGGGSDIFAFSPSSLGGNTAGTFGAYLNAASAGISGLRVDGFTQII